MGGRLASLHRSTAASVWPERMRTPPSRATSEKDGGPGRTKSPGPAFGVGQIARRQRAVFGRRCPVVVPCLKSTLTVKAVALGRVVSRQPSAQDSGRLASSRGIGVRDDARGVANDERHLFPACK